MTATAPAAKTDPTPRTARTFSPPHFKAVERLDENERFHVSEDAIRDYIRSTRFAAFHSFPTGSPSPPPAASSSPPPDASVKQGRAEAFRGDRHERPKTAGASRDDGLPGLMGGPGLA